MASLCMSQVNSYLTHFQTIIIKLFTQTVYKLEGGFIAVQLIYNNKMDVGTSNQLLLKSRLRSKWEKVSAMLKQYQYRQSLTHAENMDVLCTSLQKILNIDNLSDFRQYLNVQHSLPIQINFRTFKIQQLMQLIDDCNALHKNSSASLIHQRPLDYRNILLKSIFVDEANTINQYFKTISSQNRLKGFDLYQLVSDVLGHYYLYQFKNDAGVFFDKVDSFQKFIEIVQSFLNSNRSSRSEHHSDYVYREQFQRLIAHWQDVNQELIILENPRKNIQQTGVQTESDDCVQVGVQTEKAAENLLGFINSAIHKVNVFIEKQNDPHILKSLSRMLETVRNQKIQIATFTHLNSFPVQHSSSLNTQETKYTYKIHKVPNSNSETTNYISAPCSPKKNSEPQFRQIYTYLCRTSSDNCLNTDQLQIFFYRLGLVRINQDYLVINLIKNGFIKDFSCILYPQFTIIMQQLLKQSHKLKKSDLSYYIDQYIQLDNSQKQTRRQPPGRQRSYYGLLEQRRPSNSRISHKSICRVGKQRR